MSKITEIGNNGLNLIKSFENYESHPYLCPSKVATIGFGTTRYFDSKKRVTLKDEPVTEKEALRLLEGDIQNIFAPLADKLCRDDLSQNEFDAICSFLYNAGATYRGKDGRNHYYNLFDHINSEVKKETLIKYWENLAITGGGRKLNGLIRRRKAEVKLFFT